MSDLIDFGGWLGLTLCCAVVVGYGLESFGANLGAAQSLALGLCASIGAGSASYLLLRWLSPVLVLSRWLSKSVNPGKTHSLLKWAGEFTCISARSASDSGVGIGRTWGAGFKPFMHPEVLKWRVPYT